MRGKFAWPAAATLFAISTMFAAAQVASGDEPSPAPGGAKRSLESPEIAPASEKPAPANSGQRKYALLVGCTRYDNNHSFRLVGPGHDVELFRAC